MSNNDRFWINNSTYCQKLLKTSLVFPAMPAAAACERLPCPWPSACHRAGQPRDWPAQRHLPHWPPLAQRRGMSRKSPHGFSLRSTENKFERIIGMFSNFTFKKCQNIFDLNFSFVIDRFTNFMHTILRKVVPDNLKACPGFVRHSNN